MRYGSVCSGIEAATAAWHPLGWEPAFFSEIDKFPRAVLAHHYPDVPLHGDFTTIGAEQYGSIGLLVGGTPCQSFSVGGLRGGLDDDRGNLALEFLRLAQRTRPVWLVWENVPGVLSSNGGRDFGSILGGLVELGYGFAYRVLDAQYFGVPQRRRRVFVVGYLGDWRPAAAVLFERESLRRNPAPSREKGQAVAPPVAKSIRGNSGGIDREDMHTLIPCGIDVAHTLRGTGFDASEDGTGRGTPLVAHCPDVANPLTARMAKGINSTLDEGQTPIAVHGTQDPDVLANMAHTLGRNSGQENAIFVSENQRGELRFSDVAGALGQGVTIHGTDGTATAASYTDVANALRTKPPGSVENSSTTAALHAMRVRRLTPRECERLQGFPDDYTQIAWRSKEPEHCPDGPRYKALGNSMAVPVMRWIGRRIQQVTEIMENSDE